MEFDEAVAEIREIRQRKKILLSEATEIFCLSRGYSSWFDFCQDNPCCLFDRVSPADRIGSANFCLTKP
jgi:hypothetical protein